MDLSDSDSDISISGTGAKKIRSFNSPSDSSDDDDDLLCSTTKTPSISGRGVRRSSRSVKPRKRTFNEANNDKQNDEEKYSLENLLSKKRQREKSASKAAKKVNLVLKKESILRQQQQNYAETELNNDAFDNHIAANDLVGKIESEKSRFFSGWHGNEDLPNCVPPDISPYAQKSVFESSSPTNATLLKQWLSATGAKVHLDGVKNSIKVPERRSRRSRVSRCLTPVEEREEREFCLQGLLWNQALTNALIGDQLSREFISDENSKGWNEFQREACHWLFRCCILYKNISICQGAFFTQRCFITQKETQFTSMGVKETCKELYYKNRKGLNVCNKKWKLSIVDFEWALNVFGHGELAAVGNSKITKDTSIHINSTELSVGTHVEVNWKSKGVWYPARIRRVIVRSLDYSPGITKCKGKNKPNDSASDSRTFDVLFQQDNTIEQGVKLRNIRPLTDYMKTFPITKVTFLFRITNIYLQNNAFDLGKNYRDTLLQLVIYCCQLLLDSVTLSGRPDNLLFQISSLLDTVFNIFESYKLNKDGENEKDSLEWQEDVVRVILDDVCSEPGHVVRIQDEFPITKLGCHVKAILCISAVKQLFTGSPLWPLSSKLPKRLSAPILWNVLHNLDTRAFRGELKSQNKSENFDGLSMKFRNTWWLQIDHALKLVLPCIIYCCGPIAEHKICGVTQDTTKHSNIEPDKNPFPKIPTERLSSFLQLLIHWKNSLPKLKYLRQCPGAMRLHITLTKHIDFLQPLSTCSRYSTPTTWNDKLTN